MIDPLVGVWSFSFIPASSFINEVLNSKLILVYDFMVSETLSNSILAALSC